MATSTVPIGNAAGNNQANPALKASGPPSAVAAAPIPGGTMPSAANPFIFGTGTPSATGSGMVPSSTPAPVAAPATSGGTPDANLLKQWTDIYGKGTGTQLADLYASMGGTNSAAFQALQQSMAPVFQEEKNDLTQTLGTAGVGANSTVASLGLADLAAKQGATLSAADAQMIMQNQQDRMGILQGTQQDSASEVASSGWDVFGQVIGDVGNLAGDVMGVGGLPSFAKMFTGGKTSATVPTSNSANLNVPA